MRLRWEEEVKTARLSFCRSRNVEVEDAGDRIARRPVITGAVGDIGLVGIYWHNQVWKLQTSVHDRGYVHVGLTSNCIGKCMGHWETGMGAGSPSLLALQLSAFNPIGVQLGSPMSASV